MYDSKIAKEFDVSTNWVWLVSDTFLLVLSLTVLIYVAGCYKRREWFVITIPTMALISSALVAPKDLITIIKPDDISNVFTI